MICFFATISFILINLNINNDEIRSSYIFKFVNDPRDDNDVSFLEFSLLPNQSYEQLNACKLPQLRLIGHKNTEAYKECKSKLEWGYLKNNYWHFNRRVLFGLNNINCKYRNVTRENDFNLIYSNYSTLIDGQLILNDVIEVICVANNFRIKYESLFAQIVDRLKYQPHLLPINKTNDIEKKNGQCKPMNILLLSYDSLSRVSWFKRLPKTTEYILNDMKFNILYGQNILGDGTPACMIPLLTGYLEHELPSTLKSDPNGNFVDQVYPFIWNDLHSNGYISFHMEDWPQVSAFTYRLRGMSNKTAHHYMRAYQMSLWKKVSHSYFSGKDDFCIGPIKRHKKALNLIEDFMYTYDKSQVHKHIAIMHYIENSHDGNDRANQLDQDLMNFLKRNYDLGKFKDTAIFLYSDHGSRFSTERMNEQGYTEERMPFFSIYLPESYKIENKEKYENLVKNSQQLTTPLDIHATLRDIACLDELPVVNPNRPLRSLSLLNSIPHNRTCKDIDISLHYCICELDWQNLDPISNRFMSKKLIQYLTFYLNEYLLSQVNDYCEDLEIYRLNSIKTSVVSNIVYYKVNFQTLPNRANYEVMISYIKNSSISSNKNSTKEMNKEQDKKDEFNEFNINSPESISRTNPYGNQSICLQQVPVNRNVTIDLRKFCFCKLKKNQKLKKILFF